MKLCHFYHCFADGAWEKPLAEHVDALIDSGLAQALDSFQVGVVGQPARCMAALAYLRQRDVSFQVCASAKEGWEQETQDALYRYSLDHDGYVLYAHTKGASNPVPIQDPWRRSMTRFTVYEWRECVELLGAYDAVGCHWLDGRFFGGTFWWTHLALIRELGAPKRDHRYDAENWIGTYPNIKVFDRFPGFPSFDLFASAPVKG